MKRISFFNATEAVPIKNKFSIKKVICFLFEKEKVNFERVNYVFCSDEYLLQLNQQYLKHDTLTDIITFSLAGLDEPVVGEIYISIQRIKENAKIYKVTYQDELLRVMIHGALHLCGYTDKKKSYQLKMRAKENYYLNEFKVSREADI